MARKYTLNDIKKGSAKMMDPWWGYFVINPPAFWTTWLLANYTSVTPNQVSIVGLFLGAVAAVCFYTGEHTYLVIGAIFYQLAILCDSIDGKLARTLGNASPFGAFVDSIVNHLIYLSAVFAFLVGHYSNPLVLWSAAALLMLRTLQMVLNSYDKEKSKVNIHTPIHPDTDSWFARHKLLYPMTTPDREMVIFFVGPITGFVGSFLLIGVVMDIALAVLKLKRIIKQLRL